MLTNFTWRRSTTFSGSLSNIRSKFAIITGLFKDSAFVVKFSFCTSIRPSIDAAKLNFEDSADDEVDGIERDRVCKTK